MQERAMADPPRAAGDSRPALMQQYQAAWHAAHPDHGGGMCFTGAATMPPETLVAEINKLRVKAAQLAPKQSQPG